MKTLLTFVVLAISTISFSQNNKEIGWRFSYLEITDSTRCQLISAVDSSDLLLEIYDAVLYNRLDVFHDTSLLGNDFRWKKIPQIEHIYSRNTGEILRSRERIDYLTNYHQSDQPLADANGNPVTRISPDGFEEYVYPPVVISPLNSSHIFEIRIQEKAIYNARNAAWVYEVSGIGLNQYQSSGAVVWLDLKEIKKAIKNWKDYPFFFNLKSSKTPYRQIGANHSLNQEDFLLRRTSIKNDTKNNILFEYSSEENASKSFLSHVFKQSSQRAFGWRSQAKFCLNNEYWHYSFLNDNFKKLIELTYPKDEVEFPIIVHSDSDSLFNEAFHKTRKKFTEGQEHTFYDVHLYIHPNDIKEIHIQEIKVKLPDGTYSDFKVNSVAFVIEFHGVKREVFAVDLNFLSQNQKEKEWYNFLINRNFEGEQYFQSEDARRLRF